MGSARTRAVLAGAVGLALMLVACGSGGEGIDDGEELVAVAADAAEEVSPTPEPDPPPAPESTPEPEPMPEPEPDPEPDPEPEASHGSASCLPIDSWVGHPYNQVLTPHDGDSVSSGFTVEGCSNMWEATVYYDLIDASGTVISEGYLIATNGNGYVGEYTFHVAYPGPFPSPTPAVLRTFEINADDNTEHNIVSLDLILD